MNAENRGCQNCQKDFVIERDDFSFYEKLKVPPPTWCPHCRFVRRLTFINERSLYGKNNCGNCKKPIISMYSPEMPFSKWCIKCHISDIWDARDYGKEYDFSRPFLQQFKELKYSIPHRALDQNERNGAGCDYANLCYTSKDIYLSFDTIGSEHIKYSAHSMKENKNCLDCLFIRSNDYGYELIQATHNYKSTFLVESDQCVESFFLYDCSNCVNCCLSSNLRNKSYVFRNKQLTREEYLSAVSALGLDTYSGQQKARKEFNLLAQNSIHKYAHIKNAVNAVGDFIENAKNIYHSYGFARNSENIKYGYLGSSTAKDSQDITMLGRMEESYEMILAGRGGSRVMLSASCGGSCKNIYYCDNSRGSSDCFGCVGLLNQKYCILNKQYTKEGYFELLPKIIKHMDDMSYFDSMGRKFGFGEFFPSEISPFAYNETIAFEEKPLTKEEALAQGYRWKDMEIKQYEPSVTSSDLPDGIDEVSESICEEVIECPNKGQVKTQCTSAFKILPDELQFYKQMRLPLPRFCPNCRYHQRLVWKNPFKFYKRECMCELSNHNHKEKCVNEFETMYAPDRPEKIFCKDCYQKEVY
ncbi:MAG: hypothetical protein WAV15_02290 [Minisyncoccia bacterium]